MSSYTRAKSILKIASMAVLLAGHVGEGSAQTNIKMQLWRQPAALRGANVAVTGSHVPSYDDFASLKSAGANLVVLSAAGVQKRTFPFEDDSAAATRLSEAVKGAERAGLWVVIAIRTGPGLEDIAVEAQTPGLQSQLWVDGSARHAFFQMWRRIARAFGQQPHVIGYDMIVEPFPEATVAGLNTCCASVSDTALAHRGIDWPAIADSIAMVIRQVDTLTPVIVGATGFALPPFFANLRPIHDRYVVYDVHQYEPHAYTMQGNPGVPAGLRWPGGQFTYWRNRTEDTLNDGWLRRVLAPVIAFQKEAGGAPVLVGEFGVNREAPGAAAFIASEVALLDSLGWHGAMWNWNCCGAMAVRSGDSVAPDLDKRAILRTYRDYWNCRVGNTSRPGPD